MTLPVCVPVILLDNLERKNGKLAQRNLGQRVFNDVKQECSTYPA